ncbi:hypothetical protein [Tuwongella immobilis]|uniref:Marine sediment metagenome DNA, contig: S06H3_S07871 n=1 Tax=Tuwongella immobilis TaxID=692036 RepID=A0A6C2YVF7_9BACT|nr:hypothetical protein [Tuwongella immobilis]VIP05357.1 Marine sediment metagenome DNA, contig: S06H3_S07871 OS=marine sediment metagenome GN=S06H3_36939 PE=4 SV=1 [Tuwongella immobilis]VTS08070.1 Marine sediment metagenome DNA, contig: S06H3_S07871 OS=marine sediment metagenome GN=S06H3_36939 PE=4 SV=1 [Tuwongella immobilis]
MKVALDIDGTISEHPQFFAWLSQQLQQAGHSVLILTFRDPAREAHTRAELTNWGIVFDALVFAESMTAKGPLCGIHGVELLFEDQDECIVNVPERVLVFKIRNGGNFDFDSQQWVSTARLTQLLR